jgi:hypothetical protein
LLALEERVAPATVTSLADSGPGSLRDAILGASPGDLIDFDPALAGGTIRLSSGQLLINKDLVIAGPGSGSLTISGLNRSRVFDLTGGTSVGISGLTITNGYSRASATDPGFGGAIEDPGTLVLSDVAFVNNTSATGGGAIDAFGSAADTLTVSNCLFQGNRTLSGFGGGIGTTDTLTVTASAFTDNTAPGGGGAIDYFVPNAPITTKALSVSGTTFTGNQGANGGAIYANDSPSDGTLTLSVDGSTFTNNQATGVLTVTGDSGFGGAIDTFLRLSGAATASVELSNSTFTANGGNYGAGIDNTLRVGDSSSGTYSLTNVTSSGNSGTRGGGFYNEVLNSGTGSATVTVDSSTLDDNGTTGVNVVSGTSSRLVSGDGAAAFNTLTSVGGPLTVTYTNDTLANNSAEVSGTDPGLTAYGGGIYVENMLGGTPAVSLDSLTIASNDAATGGGGVFSGYGGMSVRNTIVASNTVGMGGAGPDVSGSVNSLGTNLISNSAGSSGWVGSDLLNLDAGLSTLGSNGGPTQTIALLPGSPAIGAGFTTLSTDQAGNIRSVPTDIGALEYVATSPSPLLDLAPPTADSGTPFDVAVAVVDPYGNPVVNPTGTVTFLLTAPAGTAPADATLTGTSGDRGAHAFADGVTLGTTGVRTIAVTDGSLAGGTDVTVT